MELDIPSVILCPHCGKKYYQEEVLSSNTFGATLWSDGIMVGSGVPSFSSPYGKCTQCGGFYVARKARAKDQFLSGKEKVGPVCHPSAMDCVALLEKKEVLPNEDPLIFKANLRRMIWHEANDVIRYGEKNDSLPDTKVQRENMERLAVLLSSSEYEEDLLTTAELLRNLGKFSESRAILAKVKEKELQRTRRRIKWLTFMGNTRLAVVWSGRSGKRKMLRRIWRNYENFFAKLFGG